MSVAELTNLYRCTDMPVFPSLFEGFGMPLVEAMAAGCPVVAACVTSIPEVTGEAGEVFDSASPATLAAAIERVVDDEAWRVIRRARGLRRARELSIDRMVEGHLAAFRQAAQAYSPPAFLWRRWVTAYGHQAQLEWPWRAQQKRSSGEWAKASLHCLGLPGGMNTGGAFRHRPRLSTIAFAISGRQGRAGGSPAAAVPEEAEW